MLYYYPSNRLEYLADILAHLLDKNITSPLETPQVILPHTGLQHWLSLYMAKERGLMMNIEFPLPTRYVWDLSRTVLGEENVPRQSPYKREVLQWRIFELLQSASSDNAQDGELDAVFTRFDIDPADDDKIFDLAVLLADIFEQYAVYRPQWLTAWENDQNHIDLQDTPPSNVNWQKVLWQRLYQQNSITPISLQRRAESSLKTKRLELPKHLYLFAIGTIPPQFIRFFFALSELVDVHFLVLNPSQVYWGDALTDKQISAKERQLSFFDADTESELNLLLRNFGQQGKEFIDAILMQEHVQIDAYESVQAQPMTLLQSVQQDILDGTHCRASSCDKSIAVHACHSAVRELQVLKEALLQALNDDASLQLDEILVLTPNIEDYAPFVTTIFSDPENSALHLPVSISDRKPVESDPEVKSFLSVLALVNSRFSVDDVFAPLSSHMLRQAFDLNNDEIERVQKWLATTAVVWGKDLAHKQSFIDAPDLNAKHTWILAIQRLVIGMCNPIDSFVAEEVPLSDVVEGQQQQVLGRFIHYLDWLIDVDNKAQQVKDMSDYVSLVSTIIDKYKSPRSEQNTIGVAVLENSLNHFYETFMMAEVDLQLGLKSLHDAFIQSLSLPETKAKYLLGKITLCSMIPMRSVPFKIIAILGLNQDSFPRKTIRSELNLMDHTPRKQGDRSRKNDDRYLFLEAILSARHKLHLSFQDRNIKDNTARSPSLVLNELMRFINDADTGATIGIYSHPLYPFDASNYSEDSKEQHRNFDAAWYRIAKVSSADNTSPCQPNVSPITNQNVPDKKVIELTDMTDFYAHPLRKVLSEGYALSSPYLYEDTFEQPFALAGADKRRLRKQLIKLNRQGAGQDKLDAIKTQFVESGDYADLIALDDFVDLQTELMSELYCASKPSSHLNAVRHIDGNDIHFNVEVDDEGRVIMHSLYDDIGIYDVLKLKLHVLVSSHHLTVHDDETVKGVIYYAKDTLKTPEVKSREVTFAVDNCDAYLISLINVYLSTLKHPRLLHPAIADALSKVIAENGEDIEKINVVWDKVAQPRDDMNNIGMANDFSYQFLFSMHPEFDEATLNHYKNSYFLLMANDK